MSPEQVWNSYHPASGPVTPNIPPAPVENHGSSIPLLFVVAAVRESAVPFPGMAMVASLCPK